MINQLEKIKCGYFECKKDNFSDIVAHAKDSHVDNPISLGRRKLDSVNQFKRTTYVNPSPCFTVWFCLMLCLFLGISCWNLLIEQNSYFPNYFQVIMPILGGCERMLFCYQECFWTTLRTFKNYFLVFYASIPVSFLR